ncbi:AI-2E family transporter [Marinobacter changyiensis]|uniref:AI-2E family transporter n=1 Tax=Marinobacter changyiensis TaxID=2604091 RepID=UPI001265606C|nr:AI-2E family transporter [Marinobacter changyiensis]
MEDQPTTDQNADGTPSKKLRNYRLQVPSNIVTPVYGLFVLGVLYTLYLAHEIILPIILALLTSLLLSPLVKKAYRRFGIPRVITSLVLILTLIAAMAGLGWAVAKPVTEWASKAPEGISKLLVGESAFRRQIEKVSESAAQVEKSVEELSDSESAGAGTTNTVVLQTDSWRAKLFNKVKNGFAGLALALALTYFLLVSGDRLIQNFVRQLPRGQRRNALHIVHEAQHEIARYLAVIGLSNLFVGTATGLLAWAVGLPSPAVWGLVAGLARFIPYLGVILTISLLAVVSATSLDELWKMAVAPVGYLGLTALIGFFLEPYIHGFRMAINPVVIFVSIFFWGWLWGPVGVLLAVPLTTVIQVVLKQIPRLRPVYRVIAR